MSVNMNQSMLSHDSTNLFNRAECYQKSPYSFLFLGFLALESLAHCPFAFNHVYQADVSGTMLDIVELKMAFLKFFFIYM